MFLTPDQVAELTGVKVGRDGETRARRQSLALSRMGIPHYINEIDRVIVARALIEGTGKALPAAPEPRVRLRDDLGKRGRNRRNPNPSV